MRMQPSGYLLHVSMAMCVRGPCSSASASRGLPMWHGILQGYARQFRVIGGNFYYCEWATSSAQIIQVPASIP